ncbi:MAG TPA: type II toxin-antitoxin system HipA family toxin, partial [Xanthobacteraceae bacterium]
EQRQVGTIEVDGHGPGLRYDPKWLGLRGAFPISLTMPLAPERIPAETFLPWAANLLPESEQLRTLGQLLGMARSDVIGLLCAIGGDTAGALSIGQPGRTASVHWRPLETPEDLERVIEDLPRKPFLAGEEGVSMSLAGVQSKLAVAVDAAGRICIPMHGSPSTHILKPDTPRLPGSVHNEAFCLSLARRLRMPAPQVTTGRAGSRSYLLAQRYDRTHVADRWRRLHQEDFCQALGKLPSAKYESNHTGLGGPSLPEMLALARRHLPAIDLLRFVDMVVLNVLLCNTDAHAKNYAIMIKGNGAALAPMYDVVCGEVWDHVTRRLAQRIGGAERGDALTARHWRQLARDCGLNPAQVLERVRGLAELVLAETQAAAAEVAAMPAGTHPILDAARAAVEARAKLILAQSEEREEAGAATREQAEQHPESVVA